MKKTANSKAIRALLRHLSRVAGGGHAQTVKTVVGQRDKALEQLKRALRHAKITGGIGLGTTLGGGALGYRAGRKSVEKPADLHARMAKRAHVGQLLRELQVGAS